MADREIRRVTKTDCKSWARAFRKVASPTRYNNTLAALRHVFEVAKDAGVIYRNPAEKLERLPVRAKQLTLPSGDQFLQLVDAVSRAGAWCSRDCADFLRGLAFTGCRKGEGSQITWRDVHFDAGEIVVRGDAETGTKNWELRRVPLIPDARALFGRMRTERADEPLDARYFASANVRKPSIALARRSERIALHITICGICLQRAASNRAWTFQRFHAGWDTRTAARRP